MIDLRDRKCGDCQHVRPFHDEERTAICGAVEPKVIVYGNVEKDGMIVPLLTTVRPEITEDDPCCFRFADAGDMELLAQLAQPPRSTICAAPGCKCLREGESEFCVEHDPEEED